MPITRRSLILGAGGVLALTGAGFYRVTRQPDAALAPWRTTGAMVTDVRLDALRYGILAPNPHNRQPWLFRLQGDDEVVVFCDLNRRLEETDPFDRQIVIGFGCLIELTRIAATARGCRVDIRTFPEHWPASRLDEKPLAILKFTADSAIPKDSLFDSILVRRSTKEPYDMGRAMPQHASASLGSDAKYSAKIESITNTQTVAELRNLAFESFMIELKTQRTHMESVRLMRIGHSEIDANPDGISLRGPLIEALQLTGLISREQIADPQSAAYKSGIDHYRAIFAATPAFVCIKTSGNSRADQIAAGRTYVRLNLQATSMGLAMHPVSQSLQEYPEMAEPFARVHRLLETHSGERVQMLARIGYGPAVHASPRWPLKDKIVAA